MKHIYVHSSRLDFIRELDASLKFEPYYQYCDEDSEKRHKNEYGRLKLHARFDLEGVYIHFMLGEIRHEHCPWCNSETTMENAKEPGIGGMIAFYLKCVGCGSRGPIVKVNEMVLLDSNTKKEVEYRIRSYYSFRKAWDHDLVDHYCP